MGAICSLAENEPQNEITIQPLEPNSQNTCQKQENEILESNSMEQNKNLPSNSEHQNSIQKVSFVYQERQLSNKTFQFDFQKILISFLNSQSTCQNLIKKLNYSENKDEQEANELALELVIYVALLDFCFNQLKQPSVRNCLNILLVEVIYNLLTYTNILNCKTQVWRCLMKKQLETIISIYENLLEQINLFNKNKLNINEKQDKQILYTNLIKIKSNNLDVSVQLAIEILEYLIDQGPFGFIREGKAKQIRLSCKPSFY